MKYGSVVPLLPLALQVWELHYKLLPMGYCVTVGGRRGSKISHCAKILVYSNGVALDFLNYLSFYVILSYCISLSLYW